MKMQKHICFIQMIGMNTHHFIDGVKVQRFSLTLLGEARLWYHSLEPINVDWPELQNLFRQGYSKVGNTQEQLFHTWRSFNFNENTETIDVYVTQMTDSNIFRLWRTTNSRTV